MGDEVDRRLTAAMAGDPRYQSREGRLFAWRPVWGWDYEAKCHKWLWLEEVTWFVPLGLFTEYFSVRGNPGPDILKSIEKETKCIS
jgi:hypothetical protein